jgi:transcription antitermination factor NusG
MAKQERRLATALEIEGVQSAYPTREIVSFIRGKKKTSTAPAVTGYVFAKFDRMPLWHKFRARNLITGVVWQNSKHGPIPYEATGDQVRQFMGLPTRAEEAENARQEAMRVNPGDAVMVLMGGDLELAATALEVRAGRIQWEAIGGMKGDASGDRVRKAAG